jgi:hypothetical protein
MKILLMWPSGAPEIKVLLDTLTTEGHEIVYWVGEYAAEHLAPMGTIFHDHYDAWDAKPAAHFAGSVIAPVNARDIESMYETESKILTMMNKRYDRAPVDERKHVYYTMLAYWMHVLETTKPDFILYAQIPHSIYSNIVYDLARKNRIPTLCFEDALIPFLLIPFSDFERGNERIRHVLQQLPAKVRLSDLHERTQAYWSLQTQSKTPVAPTYMYKQKQTSAGLGLLRHRLQIALKGLLNGRLPSIAWNYIKRVGRENLKKEYARVVQRPDWAKPFVYFPLQFQPERTSSPQGGVYHDQILAIETLSAALPEGWEIYVKEHPSQWWLRFKEQFSSVRYRGYYKRLAEIPRIRVVPIMTDSFELIDRSKAVAVVTTTAGWEAVLRGKAPLVFGMPWWRDCPGMLTVQSVEDASTAFKEVASGKKIPQEDVLRYLKALEEVSVHAYIEDPHNPNKPAPEDNMRTIAKYVCDDLANRLLLKKPVA